MLESISMCQRCALCAHQPPLLDTKRNAAIMVVGLSAKMTHIPAEIPLDNCTKSGRLVSYMEEIAKEKGYTLYRTNLVKCVPLDEKHRLRYPTPHEIDVCFENLLQEIDQLDPRIIILFGKLVRTALERSGIIRTEESENSQFLIQRTHNRCYVATYHPSYVMRSTVRIKQYLEDYSALIDRFSKGAIE